MFLTHNAKGFGWAGETIANCAVSPDSRESHAVCGVNWFDGASSNREDDEHWDKLFGGVMCGQGLPRGQGQDVGHGGGKVEGRQHAG